jgi:CheY-like chemotaxis protein
MGCAMGCSKYVLIVDDNQDFADALAALVRALGHNAIAAYDAVTGLTLAHARTPDIIFHDIAMPGMNGYTAVQKLREHSKFANTTIVAITAFSGCADHARSLASGFDQHIGKPAEIEDIKSVLEAR